MLHLSPSYCKSPWSKGLDGEIRCLPVASENKHPSSLLHRTSFLSSRPPLFFQPPFLLLFHSIHPILLIPTSHVHSGSCVPVCRPKLVEVEEKKWTRSDLGQWFRWAAQSKNTCLWSTAGHQDQSAVHDGVLACMCICVCLCMYKPLGVPTCWQCV